MLVKKVDNIDGLEVFVPVERVQVKEPVEPPAVETADADVSLAKKLSQIGPSGLRRMNLNSGKKEEGGR